MYCDELFVHVRWAKGCSPTVQAHLAKVETGLSLGLPQVLNQPGEGPRARFMLVVLNESMVLLHSCMDKQRQASIHNTSRPQTQYTQEHAVIRTLARTHTSSQARTQAPSNGLAYATHPTRMFAGIHACTHTGYYTISCAHAFAQSTSWFAQKPLVLANSVL